MIIESTGPSPDDIDRIKKSATEALKPGASGDEAVWHDAVKKIGNHRTWSLRNSRVLTAYQEWLQQTKLAAEQYQQKQFAEHRKRLAQHASYAELAHRSRQVYDKLKQLAADLDAEKQAGKIDGYAIFTHKMWRLRAYGVVVGRQAYLVFRGTDNLPNWVLNFTALRRKPGVHRGFLKAWRKLEMQVRQWLDGLPTKPENLTITGHSLGGAMAILAADSLRDHHSIANVVTFGSPRLAKPWFAEAYGKTELATITRRYIHETDLVTWIVPKAMYGQVGEEFYITDRGIVLPQAPEPTFSQLLRGFFDSSAYRTTSKLVRDTGHMLAPLVGQDNPPVYVGIGSYAMPGVKPDVKEDLRQWVLILKPAIYSTGGKYVLLTLGALTVLLGTTYGAVTSALRFRAFRTDSGRHRMATYELALQQLADHLKHFDSPAPKSAAFPGPSDSRPSHPDHS